MNLRRQARVRLAVARRPCERIFFARYDGGGEEIELLLYHCDDRPHMHAFPSSFLPPIPN